MNWILLILGGLFEIGFTSSLGKIKTTTGSEMYLWYVIFAICLVTSMTLLIKATQTLPLGTAYAIWTGIGAVGTVLIGIFVFKEEASFWRIFFIITLISSIVGLKFVSN
ncbi:DMT family transporter [Empedobacter brevis]|uniref:DMT family transporter n=1 Tax=Empedobacter brevis TaxID=247 RepID=UPI0039B017DF